MKLIKPNVVILEQQPGLDGMYKQIELAGRTCYKSEDKITEDSAKAFVDRMITSGHGAMLEHGTIYLRIPSDDINYHHYDMMYIEKDTCLSVMHSDEFDGKSNLFKDGDMVTYNTIHDKNKDEYIIDNVTITSRNGEKKYLSREEYFKSLQDSQSVVHLEVGDTRLWIHKEEYEKWKKFSKMLESKWNKNGKKVRRQILTRALQNTIDYFENYGTECEE